MAHTLKRDRLQFEAWILEFHDSLYRYALWMTNRNESAEDCVQEAYYQAWKVRKSLKDESRVFPWLLTILRRTVYREYEQRSRDARLVSNSITDITAVSNNDDELGLSELADAMNVLSSKHREILLLYGLHGLSYQEISEMLDIAAGTVMSRLSRARAALNTVYDRTPTGRKQEKVIPFQKKGLDTNE
ncbi:hypothetical protein MNBD_GAMMA21-1991 [hydrothermal vent metagenome]|uniref:RNA polymerase ECF-type sigma factor n=1 Tax=hydrothermal vent metagenome TaxID=652676 RepID=A0A3B1A6B4_9ZZZZ